jgi:Leucine-rich repeat (LRR) protein
MLKKYRFICLVCSVFLFFQEGYGQALGVAPLNESPVFTSFAAADTLSAEEVLRLSFKRKLPADFNEKIVKYKYLQELHLKNMRLKNVPPAVWSLTHLTVLDLSNNKLNRISDSLGELVYLEHLIINRNNIYELPKQISQLTNLQYISLFSNLIVDFPQEINLLQHSLKEIDMRGIRLEDAEKSNLQNYLPKTKFLFSNYCNCKN